MDASRLFTACIPSARSAIRLTECLNADGPTTRSSLMLTAPEVAPRLVMQISALGSGSAKVAVPTCGWPLPRVTVRSASKVRPWGSAQASAAGWQSGGGDGGGGGVKVKAYTSKSPAPGAAYTMRPVLLHTLM